MADEEQLAEWLGNIDLSRPEQINRFRTCCELLIKLADLPVDGNPVGLVGSPNNAADLVSKLQDGDGFGVAQSIIGLTGDLALAVDLTAHYWPAVMQVGSTTSRAALAASAAPIGAALGNVGIILTIAHHFLVALPADLKRQRVLGWYITTFAGLHAAWVFNNRLLLRYEYIHELASSPLFGERTGRSTAPDRIRGVEGGHRHMRELWSDEYRNNRGKILLTRVKFRNDARKMWETMVKDLDEHYGLESDGQHSSGWDLSKYIMEKHPTQIGNTEGEQGRWLPPPEETASTDS